MNDIKVLIADDHGVVREGLRSMLEREGMTVVGEATNGREAINMAGELQPDVILLDIRMPDIDGLQALTQIKARHPQIRVIMLTTYANPGYLARAIQSGAAGYLSKEIDPEQIPGAVQAAVRGEHLLDRELLRTALATITDNSSVEQNETEMTPKIPLSERELEVLKLIVNGLGNDAIAGTLSISVPTVKTHVRHIFEKLGVSDRTQAAVWAVRRGLA